VLVGRESECSRIEALLADARAGQSAAIVVRGEPGIGKTALLDYAAARASGLRVLRTEGIESETELPFAALHDLSRPILGEIDRLPEPQRAALRGALALAPVQPVERFAVHAATLGLLAAAAGPGPVLCLIDDAQWLDVDSAEALAFACRRLGAEGIAMLFAERVGAARPFDAAGLPELRVEPLDRASSLALLKRSETPLAAELTERVIALARGNPLGLLEIPRSLRAAEAGGQAFIDDPLPVGERVQRSFLQRASSLSEQARWALLLAAADDSPEVHRLRSSASPGGLEEAEAAGLIAIQGDRIVFRHPLVRSSVYHGAAPASRRSAHATLAGLAVDEVSRAWHLAGAAIGANEDAARALENAGAEALARGAPSVASAAFERAGRVSPEAEPRAGRLRRAGEAAWLAGRAALASSLLDDALAATHDLALRADIQESRARVLMWTSSVTAAYELLTAESARVAAADPMRAAVLMASAGLPSLMAGDVDTALFSAAEAADLASRVQGFPTALIDTLRAQALVLTGRDSEAQPALDAAFALFGTNRLPGPEESITGLGQALMWTARYDEARSVFDRVIESTRNGGSFGGLPFALAGRADLDTRVGRLNEAYVGGLESVRLGGEMGHETGLTYSLSILARVEGMQGREADCRGHARHALEISRSTGASSIETYANTAIGVLELGLGRLPEAIASFEHVARFSERQNLSLVTVAQWAPDLIEAYIRSGRRQEAERLAERFDRAASASGHPWARATAARCRALLLGEGEFAAAFEAALERHRDLESPYERARTELLYGERLRRARHRAEARARLLSALDTFESLSAASWANRARAELAASGHNVQGHAAWRDTLTPQELHVALLVAEGKTNRETATALFLSEKTIEHHLHNAFAKLNVRSRTELARHMMSTQSTTASPAGAALPRRRRRTS
jgi:DNA-binding CsgD family transcriptional regulator